MNMGPFYPFRNGEWKYKFQQMLLTSRIPNSWINSHIDARMKIENNAAEWVIIHA